jgi:hypothetical protein
MPTVATVTTFDGRDRFALNEAPPHFGQASVPLSVWPALLILSRDTGAAFLKVG